VAGDLVRPANYCENLIGDSLRLDLGIIGRVAKVLKQDGKLVATCSRYGVCFTETGFETEGQFLK
jgi:hypothetical protein